MATITPTLNINLAGKSILTELDKVYYMPNIETKKEQVYSKNVADGSETIDISDINNIRFMMFLSDTPFTLDIVTATETLTVNVTDIFLLSPESSFVTDLTSISITATSDTTKQAISVKIYGESA